MVTTGSEGSFLHESFGPSPKDLPMAGITIVDRSDLKAINAALRQAANGRQLRLEMTRGWRSEMAPLVGLLKATYLAAPSRGHDASSKARRGQPPLRSLLAKAVHLQIKTAGRQAGIILRVDGRRMPSYGRLPSYYEGSRSRWRHPVYGDREVWVDQLAHPTFYRTITPFKAGFHRRVEVVATDILNRI